MEFGIKNVQSLLLILRYFYVFSSLGKKEKEWWFRERGCLESIEMESGS